MRPDARLAVRLADNRAAVGELAALAAIVPAARWNEPLGDGRWSPAQHIQHVSLAYESAIRDLRDDVPARLLGSRWQRLLWRSVAFPMIFWAGRLPRGATAPRETRPSTAPPAARHVVAELWSNVEELERVVRWAAAQTPAPAFRHPYFGPVTLGQAMVIGAVHTRHHAAALARALVHAPPAAGAIASPAPRL